MNLRTIALAASAAAGAAYAVHRWHQADKQRAIQRTRAELERTRQQIIAEYIKQEDEAFGMWAEENLGPIEDREPLTDREQAVLERIQRGESILNVTPFGSMGWVKVDQDDR